MSYTIILSPGGINVAVNFLLLKIYHEINGCRNLARRTAISNLPVAVIIPCKVQRTEIMPSSIKGPNMFHTLNSATSDKGKCFLNEKVAISCY
jgi:hypothetical protein